ncbi:hypothetical protein [Lysinibacillus boronitolerans]|uniref:hypothetical protein n=1 Tax=Lysinibacillus boronitolerans TaxID=309788 RepID=UPI001FD019F9|nr:hypothetical protein [Lysinibacillus boronitolerans]
MKGYKFSLPRFYWLLFIPIFLGTSYKALFFDWHIQTYTFHELEDFGRYVMILSTSLIEAFIYLFIIRLIVYLLQLVFQKSNTN